MIWFLLFLLVAGVGAYLLWPFMSSQTPAIRGALDEARQIKEGIDRDVAAGRLGEHAAAEAHEALDRRVLDLLDQPEMKTDADRFKSFTLAAVPAILVLGVVAIYGYVGSPSFKPVTVAEYQAAQIADLPNTLEELVVELRDRLAADSNPPAEGYVLLARSYLRLARVEDGLAAYQVAIDLSDAPAPIIEERDGVIEILRSRSAAPEIDPETRARIEAMSPEDQAVMIENMVEGLAVRLQENPQDLQGWTRLIRARVVMGDLEQARSDLATAEAIFPTGSPERNALNQIAAELIPPPAQVGD